jgi:hypothetical protein
MLPEPVRVGTGYDDMLKRFLQDRLTWSDLISSTMPPRNVESIRQLALRPQSRASGTNIAQNGPDLSVAEN